MTKNKILIFVILCLLVLTGCSTKPQPDKDEDLVPDTNLDQEPVINNVSFNGMNNDITKL